MRLSLHNSLTGRLEDFLPAAPPVCRWHAAAVGEEGTLSAFRAEILGDAAVRALAYLGLDIEQAPVGAPTDLFYGFSAPAAARVWIKPAEIGGAGLPAVEEALAKGFDSLDLRLLCLKTHYRRAPAFSWDALEAARGERTALGAAALRLSGRGGLAPNATGLAGYKKRFRDALSRDLDFPEALAILWDALRPGALSPGSQLGALREADGVLGLLRLG
ncbi:MAG: hypothetical protein HY077_16385 [Elusimicrobia bacterium]|nr:hypothetical protein [Elusimicrobiota bacterium]